MSLDLLKEDIKNKKIKSLYLFYGPEEFLKKYYTDAMQKILISEDLKTLNLIVMEGKVEEKDVIEACETMPVFSERKLVIVKNSNFFKTKKKQGVREDDAEETGSTQGELPAYLKNMPSHVCLVFYEQEVKKTLKLVNAINKNGLVVEFPAQKPAELVKWVIKGFKSYGKEIDNYTASKLVDTCEQAMNDILNEIEKLVLYVGERKAITEKDIDKICIKSVKSKIFDLTDAVAAKDTAKAFSLLDDMLVLKEPIPKIFFMIDRQLRQLLEVKLLQKEGHTSNEIASKMGMSPYIAGKLIKQASNFSVDKIKSIIKESLSLDVGIKTGQIGDRTALELIIARFVS